MLPSLSYVFLYFIMTLLVFIHCSLAALDNNFFSSGGDIIKAKLTQSSDFPYAVVLSFCDGQFSNPCTILTKPSRVTKDHKCGHGQIASVCRNIYCLQANFNLILTDALSRSVTSISRQNKCAHGRCMPECDIGACLRGNIRSLLDEIDKKCTGTTSLVVDGVLNPGIRLTVANDLEVSRCSYMSTVELLRRHQPDGTLWTKIIGVEIEVDEDDFRAIARSALHGRASVLNDALGAKAAEKFAATQEDVHGADATPTFGAQTAPDAPHGDSEKSFDMLE